MGYQVDKLTPTEWALFSEKAHQSVFDELRPKVLDRIDYALLCLEEGLLIGYATVRQLDSESVYWQYGGGFPSSQNSPKAFYGYQKFISWTKEQGVKRISTLVENENVRYLKLAMKFGFRIIGCRFFEGKIYCELLNDLEKELTDASE